MSDYRLTETDDMVIRTADGAFIPNDEGNVDWQVYQQWLADGGVPDPYKPSQLDAAAIVEESYRAGLVREADQLQALGKNYEALKLLFKANS